MLDYRLEALLQELSSVEYRSSNDISKKLNINDKTIRSRIKELNELFKEHGAEIQSKRKFGYKIIIQDKEKYDDFIQEMGNQITEHLPADSTERISFILAYLLNHEEYIKLDDLSGFLYISRNTMTADLKKAEYILNIYKLTVERRPNYGICVKGNEFDKRICIANSLIKRNFLFKDDIKEQQELQKIGDIVLGIIKKYKLHMAEISFKSLIIHIYIAIGRISRNYLISMDTGKIKDIVGEGTLQVAGDIAESMGDKFNVQFTHEEVCYLAVHLKGKISSDSYGKYEPNIVISSEIDELVLHMLNVVYYDFKIDFRNNLELRMSLNQHMVPLDIRMQYGIPMKNPLIIEIKKEFAFAYLVAATVCTALNEHYKTNMPEDEIGYFAMLFALALEKQEKKIEKKNIIMVCMSGKGSSQLFMYKYKQAFGRYINNIYECSAFDLENYNFKEKKIDYVFTTIPINTTVPIPVFEVNPFLELKDIVTYSEFFEMGSNEFLHKYYKKELFLTEITGKNKEEVIRQLCSHAGKYYSLPENFYDTVIKREELGQTDFGNLTAIPHPYKVITKENFVTVGILEKPVWWGNNEVQVVFLMTISTEEDSDVERFYQLTTNLLFNATKIQYLISNPSFEVLISLLTENIYPDEKNVSVL